MFSFPRRNLKQKIGLDLDETFLDSGNLPEFETEQFEGVMERPITRKSIMFLGAAFFLCVLVFLGKVYALQMADGEHYAELAKGNSLDHEVIFTERGVVYDRNGIELAWNDAGRTYLAKDGFGHMLGYVSYPTDRELATG